MTIYRHCNISKLSAIVLLSILLLPCGICLALHLRTAWLWHCVEERLEKTKLTSIEMPQDAVDWVRPGKEIRIGQQYFDVKSQQQISHNRVVLTGIFDTEETAIKMVLNDFGTRQQQHQQNLVVKILFAFSVLGVKTCWDIPLLPAPAIVLPLHAASVLASATLSVPTPPPLA
jgi:hypothetical protein